MPKNKKSVGKKKNKRSKPGFTREVGKKIKEQAPQILTEVAVVGGIAALTAIVEYVISNCSAEDED